MGKLLHYTADHWCYWECTGLVYSLGYLHDKTYLLTVRQITQISINDVAIGHTHYLRWSVSNIVVWIGTSIACKITLLLIKNDLNQAHKLIFLELTQPWNVLTGREKNSLYTQAYLASSFPFSLIFLIILCTTLQILKAYSGTFWRIFF